MIYRLTSSAVMLLFAFGCDDSNKDTEEEKVENTDDLCGDGLDNDEDGDIDCDDDDCKELTVCAPFEPDTEDTWHNKPNRGEVVDPGLYVSETKSSGAFELASGSKAATLVVSDDDFDGVKLATDNLATDIEAVTGAAPEIKGAAPDKGAVLIGTIGKSPIIDGLIEDQKLDVADIEGKWETFVITAVDDNLVIAGSDQRGTIFGVYDLSAQIGVSPWYFWADVPPKTKDALYVESGVHSQGEPAVKYRGIFINDENPALQRWHESYFPDEGYEFKKDFYAKVFEVILRLKANYLWPAVWGRAFAEDDPENHAEAKRYGIVMGTSHEAPMMRGIEEWNRHVDGESDPYGGNGEWSYRTNKDAVEAFWRDGIERMVEEDFEGVVTIGMRGPGDVSLPPEDGIPLVENFMKAQRDIIVEETGLHPAQVPQVWTLYKEVMDWWDEGLRAETDVTIIFPDDNWGNMRRVPDPAEPERTGGYGLYYHFDYVGGPRNYKWVDTTLLPNLWEQLHVSYTHGIDRLWVVNVGDLKGNELPTQFFMDYAWNPERWPLTRLTEWEIGYAAQQFGEAQAEDIADLLHHYATLQSDRKPELMNRGRSGSSCPFSIYTYREMERVTEEWLALAEMAETIGDELPKAYQDTYYQLVFYQIKASALMYELRLAGFNNKLYASQNRMAAEDQAAIAEDRFEKSRAMADYYNTELSNGKWEGFQTQPYLGYSSWQQPEEDNAALEDFIYPELVSVKPETPEMGVAVDGSKLYWPKAETLDALPTFSPYQVQPAQYIEVFNRGDEPFDYDITVEPEVSWLTITPVSGTIDNDNNQERIVFTIDDWSEVPEGTTTLTITVMDTTNTVGVELPAIVENPTDTPDDFTFIEANGYVSMEAGSYTRSVDAEPFTWTRIPDLGRTGDAMSPFPVDAERTEPTDDGARLEYDMHLFTTGELTIYVFLSPRQNVLPTDGLTFGFSMDDEDPELINVTDKLNPIPTSGNWERGVGDNVHRVTVRREITEAGTHTLKIWAVDPTLIVQNIVVDTGGLLSSYLGPPESMVTGN